jgi:hypothetical protein
MNTSKLCIAAGNLLNSLFAKFIRSSAMVVQRRERFEKMNGVAAYSIGSDDAEVRSRARCFSSL